MAAVICTTMVEYHTEAVARALNCLFDVDFTQSLSNQDRHNLSDFIADFFAPPQVIMQMKRRSQVSIIITNY